MLEDKRKCKVTAKHLMFAKLNNQNTHGWHCLVKARCENILFGGCHFANSVDGHRSSTLSTTWTSCWHEDVRHLRRSIVQVASHSRLGRTKVQHLPCTVSIDATARKTHHELMRGEGIPGPLCRIHGHARINLMFSRTSTLYIGTHSRDQSGISSSSRHATNTPLRPEHSFAAENIDNTRVFLLTLPGIYVQVQFAPSDPASCTFMYTSIWPGLCILGSQVHACTFFEHRV